MWAAEKFKAGQVYKDEDLVFCRADGSRLDRTWSARHSTVWFAGEGCRASASTNCATPTRRWDAAHVHRKVMSERLGQSSITVTLDLYSHAIPALGADAADRSPPSWTAPKQLFQRKID
jgi:hypothetical protein